MALSCLAALLAILLLSLPAAAQKSDALYGADGVSAQAVRQGSLGSCYFHATIASLAQSAPRTLHDAIHQLPDGSYQVSFFDGPAELVFPEDVAYGRAHGYDNSQGQWVLVLMRAYAQRTVRHSLVASIQHSTAISDFVKPMVLSWLDSSGMLLVAYDRAIRAVIQQDGTVTQDSLKCKLALQLKALGVPERGSKILIDSLDEQWFFVVLAATVQQNGEVFGLYKGVGQGGIPERVMYAFLGRGQTGMVATDAQLTALLKQVHSGKRILVAATWATSEGDPFKDKASDWWTPNHAYSVLDYDEAAGIVRLRNPWGHHPDPDGTFPLPLSVFLRAYQFYCVAEL